MKAFLDTSVLIAAFYGSHEHHRESLELLLRFPKAESGCSAHSLLEVYARLTGMPGKLRMSPDEAVLFVENIRERMTIVPLNAEDHADLVHSAAATHVSGGAIYDRLHAQCALKANAEVLYTWDVRDFQRLAPAGLLILTPPEL